MLPAFCRIFDAIKKNFTKLLQLNLPAFAYKLKKEKEKLLIYDELRRKYLVLTPEEWVRQHFIQYLLRNFSIPQSLISIEGGTSYGSRQKRTDVLVYNRQGKPWLLAECKAPHVPLNDAALSQIGTYNHTIGAQILAVTNGMQTYFLERNNNEWAVAAEFKGMG